MLIRYTALCTMLAVAVSAMATEVSTPAGVAEMLETQKEYSADAKFEVWLPNANEPVVYSIRLASVDNGGADSLLPFDYLIDWSLPRPGGESKGFSAYFHGDHYRYRDGRLQEYHYPQNPAPFAPDGRLDKGVQRQSQFVDLLPGALAAELRGMASDSTYSYSIESRGGHVTISGNQSVAGNEVRTFSYTFDEADGRPLRLDIDTNPGQISEQTMTVEYSYDTPASAMPRSEEALIALYPDEFAKYRQSDFRLEKLPGERIPEFSVQTLDGSRLTHHKNDSFDSPLLIAVLDTEAGQPEVVLDEVRKAIELYPASVQLLSAFVDNRVDDVEGVSGHPLQGETVLYGAKSLARDCGVTVTPTLIFVNSDGTVANFIQGMNKKLSDEVLEMIANLK